MEFLEPSLPSAMTYDIVLLFRANKYPSPIWAYDGMAQPM